MATSPQFLEWQINRNVSCSAKTVQTCFFSRIELFLCDQIATEKLEALDGKETECLLFSRWSDVQDRAESSDVAALPDGDSSDYLIRHRGWRRGCGGGGEPAVIRGGGRLPIPGNDPRQASLLPHAHFLSSTQVRCTWPQSSREHNIRVRQPVTPKLTALADFSLAQKKD